LKTSRTQGLDTLRAIAILLVFMYHYMIFVSGQPTFGWASVVGWVGVDLFFVLSGYLIGNQLFSGVMRGEKLSLKSFYMRRGLRTWPAFWVVLAAYFLFPATMGGREPPPLWTFLTFTQNFALQSGTAFSHAWSLCIEEQFYFVLPLTLLIALRVGSHRAQAWLLLAAVVALGITARAVFWQKHGLAANGSANGYMANIYYATLGRFDEFIPGVAVALLKNAHPTTWQRIVARGNLVFTVGAIATVAMLYGAFNYWYIDGYGWGFFMTAFGYSFTAMAFAILVVAALSPNCWLHRLRIPVAYHLALWSYSIYLTHKAVGHIVNTYAKQHAISPSIKLITITVLTILIGALLYRLVEAPFIAIRDRYYPSNFGR
jgi:peptidoglycan/LPS O-acetylase OafA/YrhL